MHNLRHLKYIVEAARLGSITQASRQLRVSQPAISAAIRGFEEEFKIRLFVRNPSQGLGLTPSGRQFVTRARELLGSANDFENLFNETEDDHLAGRLELACYAAPAPLLVPNLMQYLAKDHPDIEFGLHEGNMEQIAKWLKDGTADLGLTYDIYPDSDIDHELITELAPFVVVSAKNPLAQKKLISLKELEDEPLISMDSPGYREYFQYYFGMHGLKPKISHRPTTNEMVRGMLATGSGYSLGLVKIKNTHSYDGGSLVNIEIKEVAPRVNLVIATLKGFRRSQLAEAFVQACKKRLNQVATGTRTENKSC